MSGFLKSLECRLETLKSVQSVVVNPSSHNEYPLNVFVKQDKLDVELQTEMYWINTRMSLFCIISHYCAGCGIVVCPTPAVSCWPWLSGPTPSISESWT